MSFCSIALGFFDGVHIAHQKIITSAVNYAEINGIKPVALTFDRSPLEILAPGKIRYITDVTKKTNLINKLGANIEFLTLSQELLDMSPEAFAKEILAEKLHIRHAVCGYNYTFGKNGSGNTEILKALGEKYGFSVEVCERVLYNGLDVSSTNIRKLFEEGNISLANKLLGRNFFITGIVETGKKLGRTLGFPTANVFFPENSAVPLCGVYKTLVSVNEKKHPAITNIGINPTVGEENKHCETYIPHFTDDIYGKEIKIEFIDFIRKEQKFDSIELLKKQIQKDLEVYK